jgi:anti-sigma-K factor RskA
VAAKLPPLAPGEILQLWTESAPGIAHSAGTFEPESTGTLSATFALTDTPANFAAFLLTREKSPAPTKPAGSVLARGVVP